MSTKADKRLTDGFISISGGVDTGKSPTVATAINPEGLSRNKLAFLVNGTVRGDRLRPRPGQKKIPIGSFDSSSGLFQGADFYQPRNDAGVLIASIDGRQWRFNVGTDNSVQEITIPGDANPSNRPRAWMYQAEEFFIIQDNQSKPFIYDGGSARRAGPEEIPVGSVGTYGMGRIWQTLVNGTTFAAGDLVYSITGQTKDILGFTENTFLNGGGAFSVPSNAGQIMAMRFLPNLDTSLGQGPLQVFTSNTIFSVNAPLERTVWQNLQYPIQTISMVSYGALSQNSTTLVNGDVFYRSLDGVRSFILARRDFGTWGNTPISKEMNRVIDFDDKLLLNYSSSVLFDNRLLQTCSPFRTANGVAHRGLMPLDFNLVSAMSERMPPAWEGLWTGLNILQLVKGTFNNAERCFAFVSNEGVIELWEITLNDKFDTFDNDEKQILWSIETGSYSFNSPFDLKRLSGGDLWLYTLVGPVEFDLKFKPDGYPCWIDWLTFDECAKYKDCDTPECGTPKVFLPQFRPKIKFEKPPEICDPILDKPHIDLFECQVFFEILGYCEIKQLRIHAQQRQESQYEECR